MTDCISVPVKWTLPSLESNSDSVFTACYCHVSQCLILSNWVMTTTVHSDTSTARSVQNVASFTQRNWVKPTRTTEHTAGEIRKSNKSNCRYPTHTCAGMHTHTYPDCSIGTSQILQGDCSGSMVSIVATPQEAAELIHGFFCVACADPICVVILALLDSKTLWRKIR